eukprot:scaffold888_cov246-Pinguiococcus_pyrenoidosus.AAC.1
MSGSFRVDGPQGSYARNGPNPLVPVGHWFDVDPLEGGPANTAIGVDESQRAIYALAESSRPFQAEIDREGRITSQGFESCNGSLRHAASAPSTYDAQSREFLLLGYDIESSERDASFWTIGSDGEDGQLQHAIDVKLAWKTFMHTLNAFRVDEHRSHSSNRNEA